MAFITGSAAAGSPYILNGEMLGGLVIGDTNSEYTGLPVSGTNFTGNDAVALDTQSVLRSGFPTGSIIAALNYAASSGDYTAGDGIDITGNEVSVDLLDSNPGLSFGGAGSNELTVNFGALAAAAVDVGNDILAIVDANDSNNTKRVTIQSVASAMAGVGIGESSGVLSLSLSELSDAAVDVSADSLAFLDNDDGSTKRDTIADIVSDMAGNGLAASSGVLSLDLSELTEAAVNVADDSIAFDDAGTTKRDSIADLVAGMAAGTNSGIAASSGVLSLDLSDLAAAAVDVSADSIAFDDAGTTKKESIADLVGFMAGNGLGASSGVLSLDLSELTEAAVDVSADSFAFDDAGTTKRDSIADLVSGMAGNGLAASSGVLSLDLSGLTEAAVDVSADSFAFDDAGTTKRDSIADLVSGMAGDGLAASSGVMSLDLSGLTAADVDVSADSIAFDDAGTTRKESLADLATAQAGSGISASSGVFSIGSATATFDADKLQLKGSKFDGTPNTTFKLNVEGGILKVELA